MNPLILHPPSSILVPPGYPLRPVNGGPLDKARPKLGQWFYEPKYNGWRALVHVPTGTMFNRKLERLSIEREFQPALDSLKGGWMEAVEWLDCEALERRHGIGRGSLIVLDYLSHWPARHNLPPKQSAATYVERRRQLALNLDQLHVFTKPEHDSVWLAPILHGWDISPHTQDSCGNELDCWRNLQTVNHEWGCQFYEGMVAKRDDSRYPLQLRSPDEEFAGWMKHRWAY